MNLQRIKELEEDVKDCEKAVESDTKWIKDAQDSLWKSKVYLAEAIIRLNEEKNDKTN